MENININADEVPFAYPNEETASIQDSRELICIDLVLGSTNRMTLNGCQIELPEGLESLEDLKRVAVAVAVAHITKAVNELTEEYFK